VKKRNIKFIALALAVVALAGVLLIVSFRNSSRPNDGQAVIGYKQDQNEFDAVIPGINKIEKKYKKWGYIPYEKVDEYLEEVMKYAEQKKQAGLITDYGKGWIELPSGMHVMINPPIRDALSQIATFAPYSFTGQRILSGRISIEKTAENIKNHFGFEYTKQLKGNKVSLEELEKLGDNDVVIWQGHGGYNEKIHSALSTSIKWKDYERKRPNEYEADKNESRVCLDSKGIIHITSKWFDKYLQGKEKGGIIFLGTCHSGRDEILAQSLVAKGTFSAVYGFNETVNIIHSIKVRDTLFRFLSSKSSDGDYHTIEEAYHKTLDIEGTDNFLGIGTSLVLFVNNRKYDLRLPDLLSSIEQTVREENQKNLDDTVNSTASKEFIIPVNPQGKVPQGFIGIYTPQDLDRIRNNLSGKYILMNDIDLANWGSWEPIGIKEPFSGSIDGNGYAIKNMKFHTTSNSDTNIYGGLLGRVYEGGKIENLAILDCDINISSTLPMYTYAGGIAGFMEGATNINNCYSSGVILVGTNKYAYVGGIAGLTSGSTTNCYNTGDILASSTSKTAKIGGIVGSGGDIANCFNIGIVNGLSFSDTVMAGGIAGRLSGAISACYNAQEIRASATDSSYAGGIAGEITGAASIRNCYNISDVSAHTTLDKNKTARAGGIVGNMLSAGFVENSYNAGYISASNSGETYDTRAGGIAGTVDAFLNSKSSIDNKATIRNCHNMGTLYTLSLSSYPVSEGGIVGTIHPYSALLNCRYLEEATEYAGFIDTSVDIVDVISIASTQTKKQASYIGFDFTNTWAISPSINNGYPYLRGMQS